MQSAIIDLLGNEAFINGQYNTAYVAKRVFAEPALLEALNKIVHPAVIKDLRDFKDAKDLLFVESAILFESGFDALCDKIIIIEAPEDIRIARTIKRDYNGITSEENINKVRARIRAQKSPACTNTQGKIYRVTNDGSLVLSRVVDLVCHIATR